MSVADMLHGMLHVLQHVCNMSTSMLHVCCMNAADTPRPPGGCDLHGLQQGGLMVVQNNQWWYIIINVGTYTHCASHCKKKHRGISLAGACLYTHLYIYLYTYLYIYLYTHLCICLYTHLCACQCTYLYIRLCTSLCTCLHTRLCA